MFVFLWRIVFFYTFVACRLMYSVLSDVEFLTEKIEVSIFSLVREVVLSL